jgi:triosephosphate isomerase
MKAILFVANWKMVLTFEQTVYYCRAHISEIDDISESTGHTIVLCPSFPMLHAVYNITKGTRVVVGAQTCSSFSAGAYTGDVAASILEEIGCSYCIVGHSERRIYNHETDEDVSCKVKMCMVAGISPILCVGELSCEQDVQVFVQSLEKQLGILRDCLATGVRKVNTLWIAYEPAWAIGTGALPEVSYLESVYTTMAGLVPQYIPQDIAVRYMYGGSLNEKNFASIARVTCIDGFLVGHSSLDFQKFRNMISLCV